MARPRCIISNGQSASIPMRPTFIRTWETCTASAGKFRGSHRIPPAGAETETGRRRHAQQSWRRVMDLMGSLSALSRVSAKPSSWTPSSHRPIRIWEMRCRNRERLMKRSPASARLWHWSRTSPRHANLGDALRKQGKLDEAIEAYRRGGLEAGRRRLACQSARCWVIRESSTKRSPVTAAKQNFSPTPPTHTSIWKCPARSREAGRGGGHLPPGDRTEAGPGRGPQQPEHRVGLPGQARRGDCPVSARVVLQPGDAAFAPYLGHLPRHQGKRDEAIASYGRAIEIEPGYAAAHAGLGEALESQDKLDEAVACYRRSGIEAGGRRMAEQSGQSLEEARQAGGSDCQLPPGNGIKARLSLALLQPGHCLDGPEQARRGGCLLSPRLGIEAGLCRSPGRPGRRAGTARQVRRVDCLLPPRLGFEAQPCPEPP